MSGRILILGAGNAQIDLIERCRAMEMEVHGVSYCDTDPGVKLLDRFEPINIVDVDGVEGYIRRHRIDYIYSVGSDIAMPTLCEAARRTGLYCFISPRAAEICCNKGKLRQALLGSPYQIEHVICKRAEDAKGIAFYPVMMKPVDSQGQRGVMLCRSYDEVQAHFAQAMAYSRCGELILERYIPGDEVSFNAYMVDGRLAFGILSDRESFSEYPGGIVKGHRLPSRYAGTKTEKRIYALVSEAAARIGLYNGPLYFQIMIDKGWPYLLEAAPRLDGCHMWRLIKLYTGVDLLRMTLSHLLTGRAEIPQWAPLVRSARTEFICRAPEAVFYPEPDHPKAVLGRDYYRPGERVRKLNGYMEKCGYRMYTEKLRFGLIGGSGVIGQNFFRLYAQEFALEDISRSGGFLPAYRREMLAKALEGCDAAVILAAKKAAGSQDEDFSINPQIAREAMQACRAAGVRRVVYISTRCVYDPEGGVPLAEDAPVRPINAYGESKAQAEEICLALGKEYGIRVVILRLAQVISAEEAHTAFSVFLRRALHGEEVIVHGRGRGMRDYVYVDDACAGIRRALLEKDASGVYNIGSGAASSIADLAYAAARAADTGAKVVFREDMPEDKAIWALDIARAKSGLGYAPEFSLDEAARSCAQRLRESKGGADR